MPLVGVNPTYVPPPPFGLLVRSAAFLDHSGSESQRKLGVPPGSRAIHSAVSLWLFIGTAVIGYLQRIVPFIW